MTERIKEKHLSTWMQDYCKNPTNIQPPPAFRNISTVETCQLEPFLDHYADTFLTIAGKEKIGFLITDNYAWTILRENPKIKTMKAKSGDWYVLYISLISFILVLEMV